MRQYLLPIMLLCVCATPSSAVNFKYSGYADARIVIPSDQESFFGAGLGKTRFGHDPAQVQLQLAEIVGQGHLQFDGALSADVVGRVNPQGGPVIDLLEAYVRYRPVSTNAWRWSVKAGAFFPPVSLENDQIGWTSYWTLTPSAINAWIGDELRTLGGEAKIEWRGEGEKISVVGSLYGFNDPAGVMLADRGWTFDDKPVGLFERSRLPDAQAIVSRRVAPLQSQLFAEIEGNAGYYLGANYDNDEYGTLELLRYDNMANPSVGRAGQLSWRTEFWNVGVKTHLDTGLGTFTILAQGMTGSTVIQPAPTMRITTDYWSAYGLVGYEFEDNWWVAARLDLFQTRTKRPPPTSPLSEDGHAYTFAVNTQPEEWLRLSSELLMIDSTRPERTLVRIPAKQVETQIQFVARFFF